MKLQAQREKLRQHEQNLAEFCDRPCVISHGGIIFQNKMIEKYLKNMKSDFAELKQQLHDRAIIEPLNTNS